MFLINRHSISKSWIWDLCSGYDLYLIPVDFLITPKNITKKVIKERVTKLFWDINAVMEVAGDYQIIHHYPLFDELNKLKRKDAVRIALKSKIPLQQIIDNLGYNKHSLYRIRSKLRKAGKMK